jgi:hypothetical protein
MRDKKNRLYFKTKSKLQRRSIEKERVEKIENLNYKKDQIPRLVNMYNYLKLINQN